MLKLPRINNKREVTKKVVGYVVDYGAGLIVLQMVKGHVPVTRFYQRIGLAAAAFAIGGAFGKKATEYTDKYIDDIFDAIEEVKLNVEINQQ